MKFWIESLQENAFDVFIVTIVIVSIIAYHYLQRWYINKKFTELMEKLDIINDTLNEALDEFER
tara:strand:+ start:856 stop:1047 length:192 start_codon:yes stop_codon:yes gene_type:complete